LSTENTESTEVDPKNKNFDFSDSEFFRDFRAFRGPEKGFPGILVLKSSISNRGISCQEKQL
jgi:hypothetical protein